MLFQLPSCSTGISQEDYDAAIAEADAAKAQVASLQSQLNKAQSDLAKAKSHLKTTESDLATAQDHVSSFESQVSSLQSDLTAAEIQLAELKITTKDEEADGEAAEEEAAEEEVPEEETTEEATKVGGIISSDTRWTKACSPYIITSTIQVPSGVTLIIEPGITITMPGSGYMFLLHGTISARGTNEDKIVFDGGGNSNFFSAKASSSDAFLDLEYCIIKNGISFWPPGGGEQYGYLNLGHCELTDLTGYSYIWYPGRTIYIQYNKFTNAGGFSIGHKGSVKVYIQYNVFHRKNPRLPGYADFWIQNWASYDSSETIVKYNSFINVDGIALKLPSGYDSAAISATDNYWGTGDTNDIDAMIYDKNDDITCAGYINYLPILTEPHPQTPQD